MALKQIFASDLHLIVPFFVRVVRRILSRAKLDFLIHRGVMLGGLMSTRAFGSSRRQHDDLFATCSTQTDLIKQQMFFVKRIVQTFSSSSSCLNCRRFISTFESALLKSVNKLMKKT
jgi:hypothetical protein